MKFKSHNHVYLCIPPVLGNENSEQPVTVGLRGVSAVDMDNYKAQALEYQLNFGQAKASEMVTAETIKFTADHVASIEGLEIDGQPVTDFETFYKDAPQELVSWVMTAIHSTQILTDAERKNS